MGVVTLLVRGGAQVLHGDQVVELKVQGKKKEKDGEGHIKEEEEERER